MRALALFCALALVTLIRAAPVRGDGAMMLVDSPSEDEESKIVSVQPSAPLREFIPTHEWQTVDADQAIPPGLHVRLDMQTGLRQAKLLEPSEQTGIKTLSEKRRAKLDIMAPLLARGSAPSVDGVPLTDLTEEVAQAWRPERAEQGDVLQMHTSLDALARSTDNDAAAIAALETLADLVDEIENAHEFERMGGLAAAVELVQGNRSVHVRATAARVLGLVCQNNLAIAAAASTTDTIAALLTLVAQGTHTESARAMFALGVLCRASEAARTHLVELSGVRVMLEATRAHPAAMRKAIVLLFDLVLNEAAGDSDTPDSPDAIALLAPAASRSVLGPAIKATGWCAVIADGVSSDSYDAVEKTLRAMILFEHICQPDFAARHGALSSRLSRIRADSDIDPQYAEELAALATRVLQRG